MVQLQLCFLSIASDICRRQHHQTLSDRLHLTLLQVVYEDEHMACIVKPQGIPTTQVCHCNVAYVLMHDNALLSYLLST